jgi:hypothetical protein
MTRTLAEECDIGKMVAFQICDISPRVSIQQTANETGFPATLIAAKILRGWLTREVIVDLGY